MDWFFLSIFSAILSAVSAITQKKVLFKVEALDFSVILSSFSFLLAIIFLINIDFTVLTIEKTLVILLKSAITAWSFYLVMLSLKNLDISGSLPLLVLTPGLVAIFAYIFLNEKLYFLEITGIILLLIGTYILELRDSNSILRPFKIFFSSKYHHYIFLALLLFTVSSLMDKYILSAYKVPVNTFMFFQHLFIFIFFIIFSFFRSKKIKDIIKNTDKNIIYLIAIIAVLTVGYRYTQIVAFKIAPIALVLSLKRLSVFFSAVAGGKIFKEKNLLIKTTATIIMVIGAILIFRD